MRERDHLKHIVDGSIILKCIFEKWDGMDSCRDEQRCAVVPSGSLTPHTPTPSLSYSCFPLSSKLGE
jgi:hypothetical protein